MKWSLLLIGTAACSSIPDQGSGVVSLEIDGPTTASVAIDSTITFQARARNIQGDVIDAEIFWRTPDTALVSLDTVSGTLLARASAGSVRLQARSGSLFSNTINVTLRPAVTATGLHSTP